MLASTCGPYPAQNVDVITEAYQEHLAGRVKRAAENVPRGQTMDEIMPKREKAKVLSFDSNNKYARGMRFQWRYVCLWRANATVGGSVHACTVSDGKFSPAVKL